MFKNVEVGVTQTMPPPRPLPPRPRYTTSLRRGAEGVPSEMYEPHLLLLGFFVFSVSFVLQTNCAKHVEVVAPSPHVVSSASRCRTFVLQGCVVPLGALSRVSHLFTEFSQLLY